MNPADFGMFWMNQYAQAQERMIVDENNSYYAQPSIGMSVLDELNHQTNSMDVNTMGLISEYTAATANGPIAITPELFGGLPRSTAVAAAAAAAAAANLNHHHQTQLAFIDDQHQTILDHYGTLTNGTINGMNIADIANSSTEPDYDEQDDEDDNEEQNNIGNNLITSSTQVQHFDIGVGSDHQQQYEDDNDDMDEENSNDGMEQYDDDCGESMDHSDTNIYFQSMKSNQLMQSNSMGGMQRPFKKKTKSTQTTRKIKPIKRPGLVLKTPIAYQPCLDPSVIPIQRDGMAVCERCGAIGVKHSFYTKERRFCSVACARGDLALQQSLLSEQSDSNMSNDKLKLTNDIKLKSVIEMDKNDIENQLIATQLQNPNYRFKLSTTTTTNGKELNSNNLKTKTSPSTPTNGNHFYNNLSVNETKGDVLYNDLMPEDELPQIPKGNRLPSPCPQDEKILTVRRKQSEFLNSYDWIPLLSEPNFYAAPVTCFQHAPGYDMWSNIEIGMKVEVENTDCDNHGQQQGMMPHSFWVATVLRLCGYKALLRYEGFDNDNSHDFWVNLCSSEVHPVGWCATRGKPLIPPQSIENKYNDWKELLVQRLSGARTLPTTFYNKINESFKSRFRCGLQLEVVNKNRISQMRLATVHKIVGKRLLVKYFNASDDDGFWVHEDSPLIHPVGWSIGVGHDLSAPKEYLERMYAGEDQVLEIHEDDATVDLFKMNFAYEDYILDGKTSGFIAGMKLEAVDPLNLSSICVATIMKVLKFGYLMIRIDSYDPDVTGADLFCYHEKSACIFPPGFCKSNLITLTPPKGYDSKSFAWNRYLLDTNSIPAGENLFYRETSANGFKPGMKIECADLMDPRLVCVATVAKTVGRVLKVHFDGWEDEYDQWLDAQSPDMYPVGWCILVGHKLEGPPLVPRTSLTQKISPKTIKRGRKKKGRSDGKGKGRANTPTGRLLIKKEKDAYDNNQKNDNDKFGLNRVKRLISNTSSTDMPIDTQHEYDETFDGEDDDDDDEYSRDGYSHSMTSAQSTSLPPTPEPRTVTPTQQQITRPSSKASTLSMTSHHSSAATSSSPTPERKPANNSNNSSATSGKLIPRLNDASGPNSSSQTNSPNAKGAKGTQIIGQPKHQQHSTDNNLLPEIWDVNDVGQFLRVNDCNAHLDAFVNHKIDGKRLLHLTKDEIVEMLSMKVGPALKIYDLIQQLKGKIKPLRQSSKTVGTKKFL